MTFRDARRPGAPAPRAPRHLPRREPRRLAVVPRRLAHHLGQLARDRLDVLAARQRRAGRELARHPGHRHDDELRVDVGVSEQPGDGGPDRLRGLVELVGGLLVDHGGTMACDGRPRYGPRDHDRGEPSMPRRNRYVIAAVAAALIILAYACVPRQATAPTMTPATGTIGTKP